MVVSGLILLLCVVSTVFLLVCRSMLLFLFFCFWLIFWCGLLFRFLRNTERCAYDGVTTMRGRLLLSKCFCFLWLCLLVGFFLFILVG